MHSCRGQRVLKSSGPRCGHLQRPCDRRRAHLHHEPEPLPRVRQTVPPPPAPGAPLLQRGSADALRCHLQQGWAHTAQGPAGGCCSALLPHCHLGSHRVQGDARALPCVPPTSADRDTHGSGGCKELPGADNHSPGTHKGPQSDLQTGTETRPRAVMLMTCHMTLKRLEHRQGTHLTVQQVRAAATGNWHKECTGHSDGSLLHAHHTRRLTLPLQRLACHHAGQMRFTKQLPLASRAVPDLSASSVGPSGWPLPSPAGP